LRGERGEITAGEMAGILFVALVAIGAFMDMSHESSRYKEANKFVLPLGAQVELAPTAQKPILVFEGQMQPKCPGDIERVEILRDENTEFRALGVICKPSTAEPTK
jgi:hypothetical protein